MTRQQAQDAVIKAIGEIQKMSGRKCPKITGNTIPIGGVPGFDSLNGLEAIVLIDERLGIETPTDARWFTNATGQTAIPVSEIAQRIVDYVDGCGGNTDVK